MNSEIARTRRSDLLAVDAVNVSNNDFLMVHVPMDQIVPLNTFEMQPQISGTLDEETVFSDYVCNPKNIHQFVAIYGESGTGKSHFIRWLKTRFDASKPENEVVLFIRRENNTLVSTIQQLLDLPEVKDLPDRERYKRLTTVTKIEDRDKLRTEILQTLSNEVLSEKNPEESQFKKADRKRIYAFLTSIIVLPYLSEPADRIMAKILPSDELADRDLTAEFYPEDFDFVDDEEFAQKVSDLDRPSKSLVNALQSDSEGELKKKLASYLNSFVETAIQRSTGVAPTDLKNLFQEIRQELRKKGKNLTLFIEDITSFTGVDQGLLDALIVEHTGIGNENKLCRLSTFVGTTSYYLRTYFKDNHQDRITKYFYLPKGMFTQSKLEIFFAKYLNAISLTSEETAQWAEHFPIQNDKFPVAEEKEGKNWEHVNLTEDISLSLYPFTRHAVANLYSTLKKQTPRFILKNLIEPNVSDILFNKSKFPRQREYLVQSSFRLVEALNGQFADQKEEQRVERLLTNWGNGKPEIEILPSGKKKMADIPEDILQELGVPLLNLKTRQAEVKKPESSPAPLKPETVPPTAQSKGVSKPAKPEPVEETAVENDSANVQDPISENDQSRLNEVNARLIQWFGGETITLSTTLAVDTTVRGATEYLSDFIRKAINWSQNGFTQAEVNLFRNKQLITIEGSTRASHADAPVLLQRKNPGDYRILETAVRITVLGKKDNWDYPGSLRDIEALTRWIDLNEKRIVQDLKKYVDKSDKYRVVNDIVALMIRQTIKGEYEKTNSLKRLSLMELLIPVTKSSRERMDWLVSQRSREWLALQGYLDRYFSQTDSEIKYLFDLPQSVTPATPRNNGPVVLNSNAYMKEAQQARTVLLNQLKSGDVSQAEEMEAVIRLKKAVQTELDRQNSEVQKLNPWISVEKTGENRKLPSVVRKLMAEIEKNQKIRTAVSGITEEQRQRLEELLKEFNAHITALRKADSSTDYVEKARLLFDHTTEYLAELESLLKRVANLNAAVEKIIEGDLRQRGISIDVFDQEKDFEFDPAKARSLLHQVRNGVDQMSSEVENAY